MNIFRFIVKHSAFSCLCIAGADYAGTAATVTLNADSTYQTIEGFGTSTFNPGDVDSAFIDMMVKDLGMSALRLYIDEDFEITNDNADASSLDISRCNTNTAEMQGHMRNLRYLRAAGLDKVVLTVFSPPAWMKSNGSTIGGSLRPDMYAEFTEWYAGFIKHIKAQTGIDVYALSPENEPAWEQPYWSCVYTPAQMRDITLQLGRRLAAESLPVKICTAEDLATNTWSSYQNILQMDTTALRYQHALAVHAYENNGVTAGSPSSALWAAIFNKANAKGKKVWMTETSGYSVNDNWLNESGEFGLGAFTYACGIYTALRYGNLSLWLWLAPTNPPWGALQEGMCHSKVKTNKYYASKQYYRYIRPGAVRIGSQSSDSSVLAVAFRHAVNQTLTLVLINTASDARTVTIAGSALPRFTAYRSTATDHCINAGVSSGTVDLPAKSIVTLYGTGYTVGTRGQQPPQQAASVRPTSGGKASVSAFTIDGRLAARGFAGPREPAGAPVAGVGRSRMDGVRLYVVSGVDGRRISSGRCISVK